MIVTPEIFVTPDCPTVRMREARENVDLDAELPKILHAQGWGVGTFFHVQFVSHDRTRLLAFAKFVVTEENESLQTNDANPYAPMTKTVFSRRFEQVSGWWEAEKRAEPEVRWNVATKAHEVVLGDEVLAAFAKEDGGKEAAQAFAREAA